MEENDKAQENRELDFTDEPSADSEEFNEDREEYAEDQEEYDEDPEDLADYRDEPADDPGELSSYTDDLIDSPRDKARREKEDKANQARMELYDWLQCIVVAIICGIFIFIFIGRTIGVDGRSMMQTLYHNDRVIMSNLFYTPSNGDIVVFHCPAETFGGTPLVKRIIATGGQTIDIDFETGDVFVDGVLLDEPYINQPTTTRYSFQGPLTVPEGFVFVMGDNRNSSSDSRDSRVGLVDTRYILGKVYFIAIPGPDGSNQRDWSRVGLPG